MYEGFYREIKRMKGVYDRESSSSYTILSRKLIISIEKHESHPSSSHDIATLHLERNEVSGRYEAIPSSSL